MQANAHAFGPTSHGLRSAGMEYPQIVEGRQEFILYWRTLPWDHAPGSLLVTEAGGVSARLDGTGYRPGGPDEDGLLVASDPAAWERTREILLG